MHSGTDAGSPLAVQDLLRLVDCIYAAASAETSWDQPVEEICRMGRFEACTLASVDGLDRRPFILSAHAREPFVGGAPSILSPNPLLTQSMLDSAPGAVWRDNEIMSPGLLETSSFWLDWMLPNRFVSWTGMIIGKRHEKVVCLEIYTRLTLAPEARHFLTKLAPHLTRAWRLSEALRRPAPMPGPVAQARSGDEDVARLARLRAAFGLTRAEARLALALADGRSPAEAAELFDRKLTTVRSQLQQIFAKTGVSRQAELVAMLLGRSDRRWPEHNLTP